jgi:transposase
MKKLQIDLKTDAALSELAETLKTLPGSKADRTGRVPNALRDRAVELHSKSGLSRADFAARLGVCGRTVYRWLKPKKRVQKKRIAGRKKGATFTELKVKSEKAGLPRAAITLELAGGAKVHGLSLGELRELISMSGSAR